MAERQRLDVPKAATRRFGSFLRLDPDAVGRFAEGIARFLGTGRFLAVQTILVTVWIARYRPVPRNRAKVSAVAPTASGL